MKRANQFSILFPLVLSIFMFSNTMAQTGSYSCNIIEGTDINSPLTGVEVDLYDSNNEFIGHTETGADGYFTFDNLTIGESYVAKFFYDAEVTTVDIEDAFVLFDHLTTGFELNEIQLLAADVDGNNSVNMDDFWGLLLDYYVNEIPFPAGSWIIPDWEFTMDASKTTGGPGSGSSFGDIVTNNEEDDKSSSYHYLTSQNILNFSSNELIIPIYIKQNIYTSGLGIILEYNSDLISISHIDSQIEDLEYSVRNGEVRIGWTDNSKIQNFNKDKPFAYIHISENSKHANGQIERFKLNPESHILDIKGNKLSNLELTTVGFKLSNNKITSKLLSYPNPCSSNFTINLDDDSHKANIQIYNNIGQLVKSITLPVNNQRIIVPTKNIKTGNYFYHINTAFSNLKGNISIQN